MNITLIDFIKAQQAQGLGDQRFQVFDPDRFDYTAQILHPDGNIVTYRNPSTKDGTCEDKNHQVPENSTLHRLGTAWWDWRNQTQQTVGIDIDHESGHAAGVGVSQSTLDNVRKELAKLLWAEWRHSTGGLGIHVNVQLAEPVSIASRKEATALAAAVLSKMGTQTRFNFAAVKDCAGGNLWIYSAEAVPIAFKIAQTATATLSPKELPLGWRDAKQASKQMISSPPCDVQLSAEHLQIVEQIAAEGGSVIYVRDKNCFQIHTKAVEQAHSKHGYKGHFSTKSPGTDLGKPNGFVVPLPEGGFLVKRFGNAQEDATWYSGANGAYAYLNVYVSAEKALQNLSINFDNSHYELGPNSLDVFFKTVGIDEYCPPRFSERKCFARILSNGGVQISFAQYDNETVEDGWSSSNSQWQRTCYPPARSTAKESADVWQASNIVRAIATEVESAKWAILTDGIWIGAPSGEVRNVLSKYYRRPGIVMGDLRLKPFHIDYKPFEPEYLPNRRWNLDAPQLACEPADVAGETPTWDSIFNHLGSALDEEVHADSDCRELGIASGAVYLMTWVKILLEMPWQRLPYLFLTSRQNVTGKSSYGYALSQLINPGVGEINEEALSDKFTGELENKVLCLIEELDLRNKQKTAYNTIKRLVTNSTITIRKMRTDAYNVPNYTHFIHTANDARYVPCDVQDIRIVMIDVPPIANPIETVEFEEGIRSERANILRKLFDLPMPAQCGRLWLPVLQTSLKEDVLNEEYESRDSEDEIGVKEFAKKILRIDTDGIVPIGTVYETYERFCKGLLPKYQEKFPAVSKNLLLSGLRKHTGWAIGKKQQRMDGDRPHCYTGFTLAV